MAINDFGEKIGGAKKDLWKSRNMILDDLSEMNAAEKLKLIKKDVVWRKPDYAALVEDGLPIKVAYYIKLVRDSLGAQPVITRGDITSEDKLEKQKKYIKFVGDIRDAVESCKTEADILALNRQWLAEKEYIKPNTYYVEPTAAAGGLITNKFLRAFCKNSYSLSCLDREIEKKQFLFSDEQKILAKYEFYKYENVTWEKTTSGRDAMRVRFAGGSVFFYPKGEAADKDTWEPGTYFVMDESRNVAARNFASLEEAQKFVIDKDMVNGVPVPKTSKKKGKTRFVPAQLAHIKRDGDDVRKGRLFTGQDFLDVFDFKGGEFGNWMTEKDRQASLNFGYEALYDLAKALEIDFNDVALNNSLSIAFGARGSGSAMAHYEPLREVINLTKMKGAGSLAHEWGHALDDIIGKRLGFNGFMTSHAGNKRVPASLTNLMQSLKYKEVQNEKVRAEKAKACESYASSLRNYINEFFPTGKMTEEQIAYKDKLIKDYLDNAVDSQRYFEKSYAIGEGNPYIDALSNFRKEIFGHVILRSELIKLVIWQNHLGKEIKKIDAPQKVKTDFYTNSIAFDKQHSKTDHGYWQSDEEMFARAFACYVKDKLTSRSDYLCGHADMAVTHIDGKEVCAFPKGEERKEINEYFDMFIQELKDMDLLHHQEHNFVQVEEKATFQKPTPSNAEEVAYPRSLFDILGDAYERSNENRVCEQLSFDFGKDF